jgi:Holliday junction resolvase
MNSRSKGKRGELELAKYLRDRGFEARRGQQFAGGGDSPDVLGIPGVHIECKRVEAGSLYSWLDQAKRDAGNKTPVVMHRRNNQDWVAILSLNDFLTLLGEKPHAVQEP